MLSFREGPTPARLAISAAALSLVLAAAGRAPLVVLIDDLQWIDRSSAEVLTFLLRRLAGRRPSFVLATRDRETGFFDPAGLPVLPVGPLAPDAARALLELRHPGLRAPLQRRLLAEAEGNPLALVELPGQLSQAQRDGLEEVPGSLPLSSRLESVFADRIRQLDPTTRMALLMVALDGERPGNLAEIRAALLLADRAWDETLLDRAATAGLVQVDHACERLTFRHPLARSCLLHMSPRTRRKAAHEVWAAALSAQRDRRAWHLAHAADGTDESVAAELADAAERMLARGGAAEAAAAFRRAAELSPKAEHRAARLNRSAFAASKGGLIDSADQALRPGSVDSLAGATAAAFVLLYRDGDINGVFRTLVPALEQAAAHPDPAADPGAFDDAFYMLLNCAVWAGQEELWPSVRTWLDHVSPTARMCFDAVADPARTAHGVRQRLDRETAELRPDSPAGASTGSSTPACTSTATASTTEPGEPSSGARSTATASPSSPAPTTPSCAASGTGRRPSPRRAPAPARSRTTSSARRCSPM
ncbi:hypothetical protein ACFQZC_01115 [Streptacidiphilus monticola]